MRLPVTLVLASFLGVDWAAVLALPAAVVAVGVVVAAPVGALRPLKVGKARWWRTGEIVQFTCTVKNRSWRIEREVTRLALVELPASWSERVRSAMRRRHAVTLVVYGLDGGKLLERALPKRGETTVEAQLRTTRNTPGEPTGQARLAAYAGGKRSRYVRLKRST